MKYRTEIECRYKDGTIVEERDGTCVSIRPWGPDAEALQRTKRGWKPCTPERAFVKARNPFPDKKNFPGFERIPADVYLNTAFYDYEKPLTYSIPRNLDFQTGQVVKRYYKELEHWAAQELLCRSIPGWARNRVRKFGDRHWQVLQLFNGEKRAADLFDSTPALAYMLASREEFMAEHTPAGAPAEIADKPQKTLAETLGFPGSKSAVKILRKLTMKTITVPGCLLTRDLIRSPDTVKTLRHVPYINDDILSIVNHRFHPDFTSFLLGRRISGDRDTHKEAFMLWDDCLRMLDKLETRKALPETAAITSMGKLKEVHDDILEEFLDSCPEMYVRKFPDPPLKSTGSIRPITNEGRLRMESQQMGNCIASYADDVCGGKYYVYSMSEPERVTIGLTHEFGIWKLDEAELKYNRTPDRHIFKEIRKWINAEKKRMVSQLPIPEKQEEEEPFLTAPAEELTTPEEFRQMIRSGVEQLFGAPRAAGAAVPGAV